MDMVKDRLLTIQSVAKQLCVDETTVHRWIKAGVVDAIELPHIGPRRRFRIKQSTMDQLLSTPATILSA